MPSATGDKEYKLPVRGLNTEENILDFPQDSFVDGLNMVIDFDPQRLRVRKGHTSTVLSPYSTSFATSSGGNAQTHFLWKNVSQDPTVNFLVVQNGDELSFTDASDSTLSSTNATTYDLTNSKSGTSKGADADVRQQPLSYTNVKGRLLICSEAINPTLLEYDISGNSFTISEIPLKIRDVFGLESSIEVDKRPTAIGDFPVGVTASSVYTQISESHEYNLYNQGWYQQRRVAAAGAYTDPIANFFSTNSEYPSNSDIVWLGMVESSGDLIFDAEWLKDQTFGSTPAPRGHYIVDAFNINRNAIKNSPAGSGGYTGGGGGDGGGLGGNPPYWDEK